MSEHTALPWELSHRAIISKWGNTIAVCDKGRAIGSEGEHKVTESEAIANATYIVRACNSHEAVTVALRVALAIISKDIDMHDEDIEQIYATLAQAEEAQA